MAAPGGWVCRHCRAPSDCGGWQGQGRGEEAARGFEPGSFALGAGWKNQGLTTDDVAADTCLDEADTGESTLLQAIRSLEKGDEEEAMKLVESGADAFKAPRSSPRHQNPAGGGGSAREGAGGGGSGAKRAPVQQLLQLTSKEAKPTEKVCWICHRPLTTTAPEDDTACARQDCSTAMRAGGGERGGGGRGGAGVSC